MALVRMKKKYRLEMAKSPPTNANKKKFKEKYGYTWGQRKSGKNKGKWGWIQDKPSRYGYNFIISTFVATPRKPDPVTPVVVKPPPNEIATNIPETLQRNLTLVGQYSSIPAVELWQHLNNEAIDGIASDVKLIAVLSEIRRQYNPNDIIDLITTPYVKSVVRTPQNKLLVEIDGVTDGRFMLLEFYLNIIDSIGTGDYAL